MKFLQGLGFVLILVGGFWIGIQLGSLQTPPAPVTPTYTAPIPQMPAPVEPVVVPPVAEPATPTTPETPAPTPTDTATTTTPTTTTTTANPSDTTDPALPNKISATVNHYQNSNFNYGFDIPANLYYSGFPGQDGARHTVGIGREDPATLADAAIRVYFYGKKVVPELKGASKVVDPAGKFVYILLNGEYSVKVEAGNINHPAVQKIIETLQTY